MKVTIPLAIAELLVREKVLDKYITACLVEEHGKNVDILVKLSKQVFEAAMKRLEKPLGAEGNAWPDGMTHLVINVSEGTYPKAGVATFTRGVSV